MRRQVYVKRWNRIRSLCLFLIAAAMLVTLLVRTDRRIRPNLCAACESEAKQYGTTVLAQSVAEVLQEESWKYEDFAQLTYDASGNVTAVETQTDSINRLQSAMFSQVQSRLENTGEAVVEVALGTATGLWLLAGKGPHISVCLMPVGHASVTLISELKSAGVNQTCHTIQAQITAQIRAAIPFSDTSVTVEYEYLLAETVIVGNVPEAYLEFSG